MSKCEQICADCPFRRDSSRPNAAFTGADPAAWLQRYAWPVFAPVGCVEAASSACLGWAIYLANQNAHIMLSEDNLREWVAEWGKNEELIFGGNGEFVRYHRGEDHGSFDWFEDRNSPVLPPSENYNNEGQGEMF